jgi:hypothetical protein
MRRVFLLLTLTLVLLVGCSQGPRPQPTATTGATYTVAPGGNDSAGCGGTMRTINAGLRCLHPGDTLLIRGGTYAEVLDTFAGTSWPSGTSWDNPVRVAGYPGETVIIQPTASMSSGYVVGMYNGSGVTQYIILDNLTFSDSNRATSTVIKPDDGAQFIRFSNSKVIGNRDSMGLMIGSHTEVLNMDISNNGYYGIYATGHDMVIDGNYIHDNGGYGIHQFASRCADTPEGHPDRMTCSDNVIRNNRVINNGQRTGTSGQPGCGIILSSGTNNQAYNNVVSGQQNGGCSIQVYAGTVGAKVTHNTITDNGGACIDVNPGAQGTTVCDNACQRNGGGIVDSGRNTELCHNWFEAGPIPEGYGARGVVTGPSATGRSYSTAP